MTDMTLTPGAGDYHAVFNTSILGSTAGADQIMEVAIFVNGTIVAASERKFVNEGSWDGSEHINATCAKVTLTAGQTVDVRWKSSSGSWTAHQRSLVLLPAAGADISEVGATGNTTTSSSSFVVLNSMLIADPGAGDYLVTFACSAFGPDNAIYEFSCFVGGSELQHSRRKIDQESSLTNTEIPLFMGVRAQPTAGQDIEIRWRRLSGTGTITTVNRILTITKVNAADIKQATATADDADTSQSDELIDGMTITDPGDADYLVIFSGSHTFGSIGADQRTFYSLYNNAARQDNTERLMEMDSSIDNADMPDSMSGKMAVVGDITARWKNTTSTSTRTERERTLVAVREASGAALLEVINNTIGIVEASNRLGGLIRNLTATIGIVEANNRLGGLIRNISSTIGITEAENHLFNLVRNITSTVGLVEASNRLQNIVKTIGGKFRVGSGFSGGPA